MSRGPCPDSPHHGDTGMDLTGTGDPKGSWLGADNVEPDIVTSGGPPTLLPLTIRGGGTSKKNPSFLPIGPGNTSIVTLVYMQ